jgi:hypothetical protein
MSEELKAFKNELANLAASMKPMHRLMANALIDGKTQEQSYVEAGGKGKNATRCASEIISENPNISEFVDLVKKIAAIELLPKQIATFEQKKQMLWDVARKCYEERSEKFEGRGEEAEFVGYVFDSRGVIAAIAELNKMDGHLAAIKTENKNFTVDSLINELVK